MTYDVTNDPVFKEMIMSLRRQRETQSGRSKAPFLERWMQHVGCNSLTKVKELRERNQFDNPEFEEGKLQELLNLVKKEGKDRKYVERMFNTVHSFYKHGIGIPMADKLPKKFRASAATR